MKLPAWLDQSTAARARRRLQRLPGEAILQWADIAGSEMSRCLRRWAQSHDAADLDPIEEGLAVLHVAVQELRSRS